MSAASIERTRFVRITGVLAAASLLVTFVSTTPAVAAVGLTAFTVDSGPGSLIGSGRSLVFNPGNAAIAVIGGSSSEGVFMTATPNTGGPSFTASVRPPTGEMIAAGTYETTTMATDTTAGLSVSGDGIACTFSTGTVTVHEVSYVADPDPRVERFAATYEQQCLTGSEPVFGELRYDSTFDYRAATVDPFPVNFGQEYVGVTVPPMAVTVANAGTLDMTLGSASLAGYAPGDYSITSDACSGQTLSPAESCEMEASFTPTETGVRNATIQITDETARGSRHIALSGSGFMDFTTVGLHLSRSTVRFGASMVLTAHLGSYATTTNKTLEIRAKPYGGTYAPIASGEVDSNGDLSVPFAPKKNTTFIAKFAGDEHYLPNSSVAKTVAVAVAVTGTVVGAYRTSGTYKLFHYTPRCPGSGRGCPLYDMKVAPNHAGKPVCAFIQALVKGSWRTVTPCVKVRLNSMSRGRAIIVYGGPGVIGVPFRVRTLFEGDADHIGAASTYAYFRITR
jgi:hypothetical protein